MQRPLDLGVFPTVLLLATLLRLSLNVASTRIVLLNGHEGTDAAGKVIEAFGEFVIGGNYTIGLVVFAILVIINFVVVTKGAGRVSEVTARFTLDAMPGRQMAIDADLNAGIIDQDEASRRRNEIREEADFFGSMDGASKFVRGDAVAGVLILFINIIGGLAIGTMQHGMSFGDAMHNYTLLTIGDGLVAQIPSLLLSTGTAIVVTRMSAPQDMGEQVLAQLFQQPKVLAISGAVLFLLGIIPGMPNVVFLLISAICFYGAYRAANIPEAPEPEEVPAPTEPEGVREDLSWDDVGPVDALGLEVGYLLIPLVDPDQGGELMSRIRGVRKNLTNELGFLIQPIHIRDDLKPDPRRLSDLGARRARGRRRDSSGQGAGHQSRRGLRQTGGHRDPRSGLRPGGGLDRAHRQRSRPHPGLHGRGCRYRGRHPLEPGGEDPRAPAARPRRGPAADRPAHRERQQRLERPGSQSGASVGRWSGCCRTCWSSRYRSETSAPSSKLWRSWHRRPRIPPDCWRRSGSRCPPQLFIKINGLEPEIPAFTLDPKLEQILHDSMNQRLGAAEAGSRALAYEGGANQQGMTNDGSSTAVQSGEPQGLGIEPNLADQIHKALLEQTRRQEMLGTPAVLLVPPAIRSWVARFVRQGIPGLNVLAYNEIPDDRKVRLIGAIGG